MVPTSNLLAFSLASIALIALPGPSVLFVIGRTLSLGRTGGLLSVLGNSLGSLPAVVLVSLGVGALVAQSVLAFTIIKFAGAAYLIWLGIQAIRHRADAAGQASAGNTPAEVPQQSGIRLRHVFKHPTTRILGEAFLVGLSNPKTLVFFVAVLPQFVDYHAGSIPLQLAELGLVFIVLALLCDSIWVYTASAARVWFAKSPKRMQRLAASGGVMMIGLGGVLAFTGNKN